MKTRTKLSCSASAKWICGILTEQAMAESEKIILPILEIQKSGIIAVRDMQSGNYRRPGHAVRQFSPSSTRSQGNYRRSGNASPAIDPPAIA